LLGFDCSVSDASWDFTRDQFDYLAGLRENYNFKRIADEHSDGVFVQED
jgi:hypothetical protein